MNLPNKLTLMRIILVPFFAWMLLWEALPNNNLIALIIFSIASITDMLDGKIARKYNMVTDFGKFADPLADKILVISAFACFVQLDIMGAAIMIIVLFREFTVTSIRLVAAENGKVVAANMWGKAKTVSQMIAIIVVMLNSWLTEIAVISTGFTDVVYIINQSVLWISAVLTIISGIIYIKDNFQFIKNAG
ncbi:MAG: CDP-diacylglycerol--glycerol-3-phosphate 3-phosphatidyltransferase [Clostridia bacterium]|nr:CDP-diacylglycerol--glycerol-3-phosphate 3-phosphatidyltransferase [Clostridia bacterium]